MESINENQLSNSSSGASLNELKPDQNNEKLLEKQDEPINTMETDLDVDDYEFYEAEDRNFLPRYEREESQETVMASNIQTSQVINFEPAAAAAVPAQSGLQKLLDKQKM